MISIIFLYHTCCDTSTKLMMGMYLCNQEIPHEIDKEGVSMALSAVIVLSYKFFGYLLEQFAPKHSYLNRMSLSSLCMFGRHYPFHVLHISWVKRKRRGSLE